MLCPPKSELLRVLPWVLWALFALSLIDIVVSAHAQDSTPREELVLLRRIAAAEERQANAMEDIVDALRRR